MRVAVAGAAGAFGEKHLEAIEQIQDVQVTSIVDFNADKMAELASRYHIQHCTQDLSESLARDDVDCIILATPTQLHAQQAIQCLEAGKHVMVEIPMADNIEDARRLVQVQEETKRIAMAGHTRRFNPSHQWIYQKVQEGELTIQQMDVQTYFFRRSNLNAKGEERFWTDHLLWHHACHTVDLFQYQTGETAEHVYALQGPVHEKLKIAMDMGIIMGAPSGALCTLSLSFNNNGPLGTFFRYICDNGTYIARYDELVDGHGNEVDLSEVDVSMNGIELQDREFFNAIRQGREPNASVQQCLSTMETLHRIENVLNFAA